MLDGIKLSFEALSSRTSIVCAIALFTMSAVTVLFLVIWGVSKGGSLLDTDWTRVLALALSVGMSGVVIGAALGVGKFLEMTPFKKALAAAVWASALLCLTQFAVFVALFGFVTGDDLGAVSIGALFWFVMMLLLMFCERLEEALGKSTKKAWSAMRHWLK